MKYLLSLVTVVLSFSLVACAPDLSSGTYGAGQVGVANQAVTGTIIGKRVVKINNNSHVGGIVGATGGALAGSFIGGGTRENLLGGLGGAVVGGLAGNAIDEKIHSQQGFEYIIRVSKHKTIAVTQTADNNLAIGTRVMVIYGNPVRVIPDNG